MIFEIFDFCLGWLSGSFSDSSEYLFAINNLTSYLYIIIAIYLIFFGVLTYNLSYVLLQKMLLYKAIIKLHKYFEKVFKENFTNTYLMAFLEGLCVPFVLGLISSLLLFLLYNLLASEHISLASRYFSVYSEFFWKFILRIFVKDPEQHTYVLFIGTFVVYRILIFVSYKMIYAHTTTFNIITFAFGGTYFLVNSMEFMFIRIHDVLKYGFLTIIFLLGIYLQMQEVEHVRQKRAVAEFHTKLLKNDNLKIQKKECKNNDKCEIAIQTNK